MTYSIQLSECCSFELIEDFNTLLHFLFSIGIS